jgi:hypothetical protein
MEVLQLWLKSHQKRKGKAMMMMKKQSYKER